MADATSLLLGLEGKEVRGVSRHAGSGSGCGDR